MQQTARYSVQGHWRIDRQDRETGEWLEPLEGKNTVTAAGKQEFLRLMAATGGTVFNQTNTRLRIYASGGAEASVSPLSPDSAPDHTTGTGVVVFTFSDESVASYDAYTLDLYNNSSAVQFSTSDEIYGTKPASQNWIYTYTLTITQNGDSDLQMGGLDYALRVFTGNKAGAWGANSDLIIAASGGTPTVTIGSCDSTYPQENGSPVSSISWRWTSGAGSHTGQSFYSLTVSNVMPDDGQTDLNTTVESLGTKTASTVIEYTFTFGL